MISLTPAERLHRHLKANPTLVQNAKVQVKVTGDGTHISHSMHADVIAFVVVEGGTNPNSPGGNHTTAILNAGENYEVLSEALKDIHKQGRSKHLETGPDVIQLSPTP